MAAVQPGGLNGGDEELRTVGAGACVSHCQQVGLGEGELGVNLVLELVAGAANAHAQGVATLNHEVLDDAVEHDVLVQGGVHDFTGAGVLPLTGAVSEADEVLNSQRCVVAEELDDDVTVVGVDSCLSSCISHGSIVARGGAHSPSNMFFRPGRTVGRAFWAGIEYPER